MAWAKFVWSVVNFGLLVFIALSDAPLWGKALAAMLAITGWQITTVLSERR